MENLGIDGSAGKLAAILTIPDGATEDIPIVIFCHGFRDDKNTIIGQELAKQLLKHGIATMRFDFSAQSDSEGEFANVTVLNEIEDAVKIYEYIRARPEFGKIAFAGHSLGGVVAAMTAGRLGKEKVSGLALFAAAPVLKDDAVDTALTLPIYEAAAKYRGGACVVTGGSDVIVPVKYGRRFHGVLVGSSFHLLPEEDHNFSRNCRSSIAIGADYLVRVLSPRGGASAK